MRQLKWTFVKWINKMGSGKADRSRQCQWQRERSTAGKPRCPKCKRQLVCRELQGTVWSCPVHWQIYFDVRKGGKDDQGRDIKDSQADSV